VQRVAAGGQVVPKLPKEFEQFFEEDDIRKRFFGSPRGGGERMRRGQGTGVIVTEDGYILTNSHVVRGANEVTVKLHDGRTFTAEIVGVDAKTDLAVLKIGATGLLAAELGDSDVMEVGDWVLAIGSPFGLDQTVTAGIVSAKGRANVGIADYEDFLQTDAAINPGNSGGPLVNMRGQVIGINTAIASRSGGNMGVGFAIPANMAHMVMKSIIRDGKVNRGWLGAAVQDLGVNLARSFGYDSTEGVLIGDVVKDSPAEAAGLQAGDIVTHYNGKKVRRAHHLRNAVAATRPGSKGTLTVFRNGKTLKLDVTVGRLEDRTAVSSTLPGGEAPAQQEVVVNKLGMQVQPLDSDFRAQFNYDDSVQGVVVTDVEDGDLADSVGIRRGDVIQAVGNTKITDLKSYRQAINEADLSAGVRLSVRRGELSRFVFVKKN